MNQVSSIASDAWKSRRPTLKWETDLAAGQPCRLTDTFAVCNFLFASSPKIVVIIPGAQGQKPGANDCHGSTDSAVTADRVHPGADTPAQAVPRR